MGVREMSFSDWIDRITWPTCKTRGGQCILIGSPTIFTYTRIRTVPLRKMGVMRPEERERLADING